MDSGFDIRHQETEQRRAKCGARLSRTYHAGRDISRLTEMVRRIGSHCGIDARLADARWPRAVGHHALIFWFCCSPTRFGLLFDFKYPCTRFLVPQFEDQSEYRSFFSSFRFLPSVHSRRQLVVIGSPWHCTVSWPPRPPSDRTWL